MRYYLFPNLENATNLFGIAPLQDRALPKHKAERPGYLRHLALVQLSTSGCDTPALSRVTQLPQASKQTPGLHPQQDPSTALEVRQSEHTGPCMHVCFPPQKKPPHITAPRPSQLSREMPTHSPGYWHHTRSAHRTRQSRH